MSKNILSEELNQIKYLFGYQAGKVISEQKKVETKQTNVFPKKNLSNLFPMGAIDSPELKAQVESLKPQIEEFIKNNDQKQFVLNINAGESQITNPKGYETKGSLALARANTLRRHFEEVFSDLIQKGVLKINSPQDVDHVLIGNTTYYPYSIRQDHQNKVERKWFLDHEQDYKNEQFVTFDIEGVGESTKTSYICDYKKDAEGGMGKVENNFVTQEDTIDISMLPNGQKIQLTLNSYTVPDMLWVEAGGKIYTTNFTSMGSEDQWNLILATILGNYYKGNQPPEPLPQGIVKISPEEAWKMKGYQWNLENFMKQHINVDWSKKPEKLVKDINWYKFQTNPVQRNLLDGRWAGGSIVLTKDSSMNSITYRVYSPIGTTKWTLTGRCL